MDLSSSSSSSSSSTNWQEIRQYADAELDALVKPELERQSVASGGWFRQGPTPKIVEVTQIMSQAMESLPTTSDTDTTRRTILARRLELITLMQENVQGDVEKRSLLDILKGLYTIFQTVQKDVLPAESEETKVYPNDAKTQYDLLTIQYEAMIRCNTPESKDVAVDVLKRMIRLADQLNSPETCTRALNLLFEILKDQTADQARKDDAPRMRRPGDAYEKRLSLHQQFVLDEIHCRIRLEQLSEDQTEELYYQQHALVALQQNYLGLHEWVPHEEEASSIPSLSSPTSSRPRSPETPDEDSEINVINGCLEKDVKRLHELRTAVYQQRGEASARALIALTNNSLSQDYTAPAALDTPEDHNPLSSAPYALVGYESEYKALAKVADAEKVDKDAFEEKVMPLYSRMLELQQHKINTLQLLYADDHRRIANQSVDQSSSFVQSKYRDEIEFATGELKVLIETVNSSRASLYLKAIDTQIVHIWEWTDWGRILLHGQSSRSMTRLERMLDQLRTNFRASINSLEKEIKDNEAALAAHQFSPAGEEDGKEEATVSAPPQLSSDEIENKLAKLRISRSAAILQRMIDQIGHFVHERDDLMRQRSGVRGQVAFDPSTSSSSPSSSSSSSSPSSLPSSLSVQHQDLGVRIERRNHYINVLTRAFKEELSTYRRLPRPIRSLVETIRETARNEAIDFATFGMGSETAYTEADEFLTRMNFAQAGYSIAAGVDQWSQWRSSDHNVLTLELVQDFLAWANEHPTEAVQLTDDILLTLDTFQRRDLVSMLQRQMAAKVYMSSFLQTLGITPVDPKPIGPHDFRWRALADLAHYGPQAAAGTNAMTDAMRELIRGNLVGAITSGISRYAIDGYRGRAIQRLMGSIDNTQAQAAHAALSFMRGEPMQQIAATQARMSVLRIAGGARQALQDPARSIQRLFGHMVAPLRQIRHATGRLVERGTRVVALTSPHLATGFVSLSMYQGVSNDRVSLVAASITVTVTVFFALLTGLLLTRLVNRGFSNTVRRIERDDIESNVTYVAEINREADRYVERLRERQVIPQYPSNASSSSSAEGAALGRLVVNLHKTLLENLNDAEAKEQARLRTRDPLSRDPLSIDFYVTLFVRQTPESEVIRLIDQTHLPGNLTHDEAKQYKLRIARLAIQALITVWLKPKIQESMQQEFLREYEQLGHEDDIDRAVEARLSALNGQREAAVGNLIHSITSHTPNLAQGQPGPSSSSSSSSSSYELSEDDRTHVGIAIRRLLDQDPA